jgi:hypothetical protein
MSRYLFAVLFLAGSQQAAPLQDDTANTLLRAQALYYEARFRESIELLLPLDSALRAQPERRAEKIDIKLQLALAHIGLSETSSAKSRFAEICALDPDYALDPQRYAPKVISLFEDSKTEQEKAKCQMFCSEADRLLAIGDAEALLKLIDSAASKCVCLESAAMDGAAQFYQQGVDAYKKNDFGTALQDFRIASRFQPEHELAGSYIELIQNQLRLSAERSVLEWRAAFEAREFGVAAATYRRLEAANIEGSSAEALDKIRTGYRQQLSPLAESSKQACSAGDALTAERIRRQAEELLPDPAIGQDILAEIGTCAQKGCLQLSPERAMDRLITREDPKIPKGLLTHRVTVQVKVRIDEKGKVAVTQPESIDPALRNVVSTAAATWKFLPATAENETRCVETQIPIVLAP